RDDREPHADDRARDPRRARGEDPGLGREPRSAVDRGPVRGHRCRHERRQVSHRRRARPPGRLRRASLALHARRERLPDAGARDRLAWFRANHPDAEAAVALSFGDWIVARATGVWATDPTQAAEMLVYDVALGRWSPDLLGALSVPETILPSLRPAGEPAGVAEEGNPLGLPAGLGVFCAGADTQCAALGLGVVESGSAFVVSGTTMIAQQLLGDYALDPTGRTWTSPHLVAGLSSHESHCGEAGSALVWLSGLLKETPS